MLAWIAVVGAAQQGLGLGFRTWVRTWVTKAAQNALKATSCDVTGSCVSLCTLCTPVYHPAVVPLPDPIVVNLPGPGNSDWSLATRQKLRSTQCDAPVRVPA